MLDDNFSSKLFYDNNNNNTDDDGVFYEEDEKLAIATQECYKTGTLIPLLKEELKFKILAKCHEQGKELIIDTGRKTPPPKKKLQPDEERKLEKRREQNRRAAKKFRERKRSETDKLEQMTTELECHNEELRQEIIRLSTELNELNALWTTHICVAHLSGYDEPRMLDVS